MIIEFSKTKDESTTFSADKVFFHSTYSPIKEAERFVHGLDFPIVPKLIFFIEPGLSYCYKPLKEKFPEAKIICIRFFDDSVTFPDENNWDSVIRYKDCKNLNRLLIDTFSEEFLLCSTAIIWKPAQNLFSDLIQDFFQEYRRTLEDCKTLLVTRQFFEKKWLTNCCSFAAYVKSIIQPDFQKTDFPVVICASGPSLEPCLPFIKQYREKIFLLCLSSATTALLNNTLIPDIILTTDGGYWAGEHLKILKKYKNIPLAAPAEAYIPKEILLNNSILPLKYTDSSSFISSSIIEKAMLPSFDAVRNPTVSGTAFYFAKAITTGKIFFCGLDLHSQKGFQHTQPNELEKNNMLNDTRLTNNSTRISHSRFNSQSLKIYEDWFASLAKDVTSNTFRVIDKSFCRNSLGNIPDIDSQTFEELIAQEQSGKNKINFTVTKLNSKTGTFDIIEYVCKSLNQQQWQKQIFPADFISINNTTTKEEKQKAQERLQRKIDELIKKIRKLSDE